MGPFFVFSQGNSPHSKHNRTPSAKAQEAIWHILFSRGTQPAAPFGHKPLVIRGIFRMQFRRRRFSSFHLTLLREFLAEFFRPSLNLLRVSAVGDRFAEYLDAAAKGLP